ncbi:MFS transporter [Altererythrobacter indicus]|uniref:MFS transporter n=1 Tax=Altericroceibacterium indicum TaxID=374177 RepID=A0A845A5Z4_9SPHN|nr:MFS transporter [Altericroceibacterium indicum]MXP24977.1 MFS transporter [Altericroceibacterium indicum]
MSAATASPNARRGVLFAAITGNALCATATVHAVFGTFLVPLSEAFAWPRASISVVLGIIALSSAIVYPLAGRYADSHGTRRMVLIGNVLFALSVGALAFSNGSLPMFYATFLAIGIFGGIPSTAIFSKLVAEWFRENRGTALGISAGLGNGIGAVCLPILAAVLVSHYGWQMGYVGIALLIAVVGTPVYLAFLKDAPGFGKVEEERADSADGLSVSQAARKPAFWFIMIAIAAGGGISTAVLSHVVPIVGDRGFSLATGTAVLSVLALVGSIWQIVTGRMLDKSSGPRIIVPMYALAIIGLFALEYGPSSGFLIAGGTCLGISLGCQFGSLPFFIARYFGLRHFGAILGVMYSAVIAAQGTTPVLLDMAFDTFHTYRPAIHIAMGIMAAGSMLLLLLPAYRSKVDAKGLGVRVRH